jgi:hypothetical protein
MADLWLWMLGADEPIVNETNQLTLLVRQRTISSTKRGAHGGNRK